MYILRGNSSRGIANRICSGLNQNFTFYLFILLLNLETILLLQYVYPILETSTFGNEIWQRKSNMAADFLKNVEMVSF